MKPVVSLRVLAAFAVAICVSPTALAPRNNTYDQIAGRLANGESVKFVVYGTSLSANGAWVSQVREILAERYPGRAEWINESGSGKNSDWGLANVDSHVVQHQPDVVFLEFAINDAVARFSCSVEQAEQNLRTIIDKVRDSNRHVQIILQTTNPVFDRPVGHDGHRKDLAEYYAMVRRVAKDEFLRVADQEKVWKQILHEGQSRFRALVPDGLHPNSAGNEQVVTPTILGVLGNQALDKH